MQLAKILNVLQAIAPESLAEPWDKVGLHVGDSTANVRRAMLCIDLTEPVMAEAVKDKADLIVAYHPPIFQPIQRLTTDTWKGRVLLAAARKRIAIYSPHTALDAAKGGVNDWLAQGIGPGTARVIEARSKSGDQYKIVTFVPSEFAAKLRAAMSAAGAGVIGDYEQCSFNSPGQGTFVGRESTRPFVGQAGRLESIDELRMEMVCPTRALGRVIAALRAEHPYEEPAFDIYALTPPPVASEEAVGQGRVVTLDKATSVAALTKRIKAMLGVKHLDVALPAGKDGQTAAASKTKIKSIALCAGAGVSVVTKVADEVDAYFTGEMRHHDALEAVQSGKVVILAGHTQTERPYLKVYRDRLDEATDGKVAWSVSRIDRAPSGVV